MSEQVVIFTKPGCPYCRAAKEDLDSRGVAFTEHDVTVDPAKKEEAFRLSGQAKVPVIVRGAEITVGFGGS